MAARKKNILLICFDDAMAYQKYKTVFKEPLQTPNLDRIAGQAATFHSAYCQAPVCGPSRSSFMTARTPHQLGILDNYTDVFDIFPTREFWQYRLKEDGYFCSSGGKMHHRYRPVRRRFHTILYSDAQKRFQDDMNLTPEIEKHRYGGHRGGWGTTNPDDDGWYYDAQSADSAVEFFETYDGDQPFYREVGFFSPHGPHYTPARFKDMYDVDNFTPPESWAEGFDLNAYTEEHSLQNDAIKAGDWNWWRCSVRNYFAALSHGDYHLGRVWDALQASGHADNTIVIIISDHGFHLGNRNRYRKSTVWEQAAGVPFIIYDPDDRTRKDIDDPVALLDVGPTVLDYAGLGPIDGSLGRSVRPYLDGGGDPDRAVATFYFNNAAIRKGPYRIIRFEDGSTQFFDLETDYWQHHDLGQDHPDFDWMYAELVASCAACGLEIPDRPGQV